MILSYFHFVYFFIFIIMIFIWTFMQPHVAYILSCLAYDSLHCSDKIQLLLFLFVSNLIHTMLLDGTHFRTILLFWSFSDYVPMHLWLSLCSKYEVSEVVVQDKQKQLTPISNKLKRVVLTWHCSHFACCTGTKNKHACNQEVQLLVAVPENTSRTLTWGNSPVLSFPCAKDYCWLGLWTL